MPQTSCLHSQEAETHDDVCLTSYGAETDESDKYMSSLLHGNDDDMVRKIIIWGLVDWGFRKYRVFIEYCAFSLNVVIFLNSASSAAALVFYLPFSGPGMKSGCTHRAKSERGQSPEYILKLSKKHNI